MIQKHIQLILLAYFRFWARIAIVLHQPIIIGVTGSAGKTSCKHAIGAILNSIPEMRTAVLQGNSESGVSLSILGIEPKSYSLLDWLRMTAVAPFGVFSLRNTDTVVIEYGIDSPYWPKNMEYLLHIVQPDIAVILTVSGAHMMEFEKAVKRKDHENQEAYRERVISRIAEEKMKLATQTDAISIVNKDNPYMQPYVSQECLTFGKTADLSCLDYSVSLKGTIFSYRKDDDEFTLNFPNQLLPEVYQYTFAGALLACMQIGVQLDLALSALENMEFPKGRSTLLPGIRDSVIVDSSYNSSKEPLLSLIDMTRAAAGNRPVVFLFGDMRELGESGDLDHEDVARYAAKHVDYVFAVGKETQKVLHLFSDMEQPAQWFTDSRSMGAYLQEHLPQESIVLAKGSQNTIFLEEAVEMLLQSTDDTQQLCRQSADWKKKKDRYFASLFRKPQS